LTRICLTPFCMFVFFSFLLSFCVNKQSLLIVVSRQRTKRERQSKRTRDRHVAIILCVNVSYLNMFILFYSISFIIILEFPIEYYRYIIMWFFSRCISIDSLNTCFQQQKHKTSYDFCFCTGGSSSTTKRWENILDFFFLLLLYLLNRPER
jgi:hypothetical protein